MIVTFDISYIFRIPVADRYLKISLNVCIINEPATPHLTDEQ